MSNERSVEKGREKGEGGLTRDEQEELLRIARRAAAARVAGGPIPAERPVHARLSDPGAAFVTLRRGEALRGCIGWTEARAPLYRTVQECAAAAATQDPRFFPVTPAEMDGLDIEISVLSPLSLVRPEDVAVGVHGLLIRKGTKRGLLLPQVPVEYGWGRRTFLSQVCEKAGLPPDTWREGAELYSFTAEVFGERGPRLPASP